MLCVVRSGVRYIVQDIMCVQPVPAGTWNAHTHVQVADTLEEVLQAGGSHRTGHTSLLSA